MVRYMNPGDVMTTLLENQIITESVTGSIDFTDSFKGLVDEARSRVSEGSVSGDTNIAHLLAESPELAALDVVLESRVPDLPRSTLIQAVTVLDYIDSPPEYTSGAPEHFLPVQGGRLPSLLAVHDRAIVYIWREDCKPCDLVFDDFSEIFFEPPEDISLFAVYGPPSTKLLSEGYDVIGAPTILFVVDGEVDARLVGAPPRVQLESEVEYLQNLN